MIVTGSRVTGLAEARKLLRELPGAAERRVLRSATRAGATVLRRELRRAAPADGVPQALNAKYGTLRKNIRSVRLRFDVPRGTVIYRVHTGKAFWAWFLEYGTGPYNTNPGPKAKGAAARTRMRPRPWFRRTVDAAGPEAVARLREQLGTGVEREALRLASQYGTLGLRQGRFRR